MRLGAAPQKAGACLLPALACAMAKAAEWYTKAAEQGNSDAQHNLAVCYENGEGVEMDEEEAVEWYQKAAEQGHSDAQTNLDKLLRHD